MAASQASECRRCSKSFGLFTWRHDCAECESTVCDDCLSDDILERRVCDTCHTCWSCRKITKKKQLKNLIEYPCCPACRKVHAEATATWLGGTKHEAIPGCAIVKDLGVIRVEHECEDPAEVENHLKVLVALAGGNGYVKLFWKKNFEQQSVLDGFGKKGNPHYHTQTTVHYMGYATGIVARRRTGGSR